MYTIAILTPLALVPSKHISAAALVSIAGVMASSSILARLGLADITFCRIKKKELR